MASFFSNQIALRPRPDPLYQLTHPGALESWQNSINSVTPGSRTGTTDTGNSLQNWKAPTGLGGGATLEQVAQLVNEIDQAGQRKANDARIEGGAELQSISTGNTRSALLGEVDPSIKYELGQAAAERGAQMGIASGSPSNNAGYLKALGLTSYDLYNKGENWLTQALARNPSAPLYSAGNLVITPQQQAQLDLENRRLQETSRSNLAREALAWDEARRRGTGNAPYLSGMFGVGSGGGGGGFTGKAPYTETDPRFKPQLPDLWEPTIGSTGSGTGRSSLASNWDDAMFEWNASTPVSNEPDYSEFIEPWMTG